MSNTFTSVGHTVRKFPSAQREFKLNDPGTKLDSNIYVPIIAAPDHNKPASVNISDEQYQPFKGAFAKVKESGKVTEWDTTNLQKAPKRISGELENLVLFNLKTSRIEETKHIVLTSLLPMPIFAAPDSLLMPVPPALPPSDGELFDNSLPTRNRAAHRPRRQTGRPLADLIV